MIVTQPTQFLETMQHRVGHRQMPIDPERIIVDDYEHILQNNEEHKALVEILREYLGIYRSSFGDENKKRKFIITTSELDENMSIQESKQMLQHIFTDSELLVGEDYWKVEQEHEHIIKTMLDINELQKTILEILQNWKGKKAIIVSDSDALISDLSKSIDLPGQVAYTVIANLKLNEKTQNYFGFMREVTNSKCVLLIDTASQGSLYFEDVDLVIYLPTEARAQAFVQAFSKLTKRGTFWTLCHTPSLSSYFSTLESLRSSNQHLSKPT